MTIPCTQQHFVYASMKIAMVQLIAIILIMLHFMTRTRNIVPAGSSSSISKFRTHSTNNQLLETSVECRGPLYNQSCLYRNLYFVNSEFRILTVKGAKWPDISVRTDAFILWGYSPDKFEFESYEHLEKFVRHQAVPKIFPDLTVYFGVHWHDNIGHALFDGLYPAYVALIRFAPRHLNPFRILLAADQCNVCWSENVFSRFGGLGIIKMDVLKSLSNEKWFLFDQLLMGSGRMCQRCTQPNLQLPGGIELDGSRLFRNRIYKQHGVFPAVTRQNHSAEGRTRHDLLIAYVIDNKRFSDKDKKEIFAAIDQINNYTNTHLNKTLDEISKLTWPLIHVSYLYYDRMESRTNSSVSLNASGLMSQVEISELTENKFKAQLRLLRKMDIHVTGPGTGQMYQSFLSDGCVNINLGGLRPWAEENPRKAFASFIEQYMTGGTPYIKGLFYPINERPKGIQQDQVVKLIRQAANLILDGFSIPVNLIENLAPDGQLFVEMCELDPKFCSSVTFRSTESFFPCLDIWVEDMVHEDSKWKQGGIMDGNRNISCPLNHTLLRQLRQKYGIIHYEN